MERPTVGTVCSPFIPVIRLSLLFVHRPRYLNPFVYHYTPSFTQTRSRTFQSGGWICSAVDHSFYVTY